MSASTSAQVPTSPAAAFAPGASPPTMSSSPSRSRRAASPAMRALVAAWLVDAAPSATSAASPASAASPPTPTPTPTRPRSLLARLAAALRFSGDGREGDRAAGGKPAQKVVVAAGKRRAGVRVETGATAKAEGKAFGEGDVGGKSGRKCVSALCGSLYSKFAVGDGEGLSEGLPFLGVDESGEGRGILDAMRTAREQALAAAAEEASGKGVGRLVGGIGGALFAINPLK